jgi:hypothetical protein
MRDENSLPRCPTCGAPAGLDCRTIQGRIPPHEARLAIAAGTRRAETVQHGSVPEGCQSGGEAASPNPDNPMTDPTTKSPDAKCQHDWLLFANELVAVRVCRRCGLREDAS